MVVNKRLFLINFLQKLSAYNLYLGSIKMSIINKKLGSAKKYNGSIIDTSLKALTNLNVISKFFV